MKTRRGKRIFVALAAKQQPNVALELIAQMKGKGIGFPLNQIELLALAQIGRFPTICTMLRAKLKMNEVKQGLVGHVLQETVCLFVWLSMTV